LPGLYPTLVAALIQFTREFNFVKNSFDLLFLDHSLEVLSTVYRAQNFHW